MEVEVIDYTHVLNDIYDILLSNVDLLSEIKSLIVILKSYIIVLMSISVFNFVWSKARVFKKGGE